MNLSHRRAQDYVGMAADDLLSAEKLRELQRHLDDCPDCRAYVAEFKQLETRLSRSLQSRWPNPSPNDPRLIHSIEQVQAQVGKRHLWRRVYDSAAAVAWAGLIIALVIVVAWLFRFVTPQLVTTPSESPTPAPMATPASIPTRDTIIEPATPIPEAQRERERVLTVCMGAEPDTLYLYGSQDLAARHIHEAIYDGPIDQRSFGYQPVILEKLPSLANGEAITEAVAVTAGDLIVDYAGEPMVLQEGVLVRVAGCHSAECAVAFDGTPLAMERLIVTFTLKPGILWSDGEPLTAYDSVYAFELDRDPDTPSDKQLVQRTANYRALDDFSTVWTGLPGYLDSAYMTNFWTPLPEHAWGVLTALELNEAHESTHQPLGWGPYVIDEWIAADHITLTRNKNYWRAKENLPRFESVVFRFVGDNANATIAALLSGECDIADQTTHLDDQSEMLLALQAVDKLNALLVTGTVWEHVDFGIQPVPSYDRPGFFDDVRVRQAIAYCLDRQAVVDAVIYGQSQVLDTFVSPQHPLYNPDVKHYPFDPQRGAALLEKAGWIDADGNPETARVAQGVVGVPDGTPLAFSLRTTDAQQRQATTRILQTSLAQCGISASLERLSPSEFFAEGPDGPIFGRHFDLAQFAWLTGTQPPCDLYTTRQITGDREAGFCGWNCINNTGFSNAAYDAACTMALQSLPDTPAHEQAHLEAQRIFAEQLPVVPLYLHLKVAATRPDLKNFSLDPTADSEFSNIEAFDFGN